METSHIASGPFVVNNEVIKNNQNKLWTIYQMNNVLDAYQNGLCSNKDKFESLSNDELSKLLSRRNSIFSVIGLIITIIVGLATVDSIKTQVQPLLAHILIASALCGVVTYGINNVLMRQTRKRLLIIEKAYQNGYAVQNFMKGFLGRIALINSLTANQLYILHLYYIAIQGGLTSKILSKYRELYSEKSSDLEEVKIYHLLIDNAYEVYDNSKEKFENEEFRSLFKYYKTSENLFREFEKAIKCLQKYKELEITKSN